ncbi:hypothetical protein Bca52824_040743 [Brassica carinata]|uniref:F-box associated beta-propeller type 1 domain-containing protein n=1 Tax=Brassica carinata TaxID=52824 RepID=A0A8X7UX77_BRACI|nr:hypothetical protein Bca52824_040743 [Brassica carinata]
MIHCDGLLLCRFDNRDNNLVVWNPSYTGPPGGIYGFGYDNVSRDNYKILRFKKELEYEVVEIYEFKSQLWRRYTCHVSINGNMYWYAGRDNDNSELKSSSNTCCVPFVNGDWHSPFLSGFGEDRLSLLSEHKDETMIQVWVTNKVTDEIVSWRKYFNVTYEIVTRSKYFNVFPPCLSILSTSNFPTYFIHKTNRIMLWYEKEDHQDENIYVNLYEIGGGEVKKLVETGRHRRWDMCDVPKLCYVFVPNLVPVPE